MLKPGDPFPPFSLSAHDGTIVHSEALEGSAYLVYFYPRADTPGCTREACSLRDSWKDLEQAGVTVYGVSFDSPKRNEAFAAKYQLPFLLLSDSEHELASAAGAKLPLLPVPKRVSYLVGSDGNIIASYSKVHPNQHAAEVLEDAERLL